MKPKNAVSLAVESFGYRNGLQNGRGAQKEIANRLGVTRQTVRNWCITGSVSTKHLEKFSEITQTDPREINALVRRVAG